MPTKTLIINDPVYGFINIPRGLLCRLVAHPLFQRLERIRQLGMAPMVYPGAYHTRKQHSIGALHLMQLAFSTLIEKGYFIFDSEIEAAEVAILLHDIGHGPFSHVLEKELVRNVSHEYISQLMMRRLNEEFHGELSMAISIFQNNHPKPFLHELISSQLDVDRLDYLCRDSFFTGVREGNIGAARIVRTMDLAGDHIVVDAKGIYAVENYLMARRLMYWQVYLHKTALAAEEMLRAILRRARFVFRDGKRLFASPALDYFLTADVSEADFSDAGTGCLERYAALDDSDLISAIKVWQESGDSVLSTLAKGLTNRRLFKVETCGTGNVDERMAEIRHALMRQEHWSEEEAAFFVKSKSVGNEMYSKTASGIGILMSDGTVKDVSEVSSIIRNDTTSPGDQKTYIFYPRHLDNV